MPTLPEGITVKFNEEEFNFSFASSGIELIKGLSHVEDLGSYHGMLFDFGCDYDIHMWAKDLLFPIDVAFLSADGTVLQFGNLNPNIERSFTLRASTPARYALEVPERFFERHNIKIGDRLQIN
jgi:uncharacterized membrane protein (UPF0127 family)